MSVENISESSFLGKGWSFPPTFNLIQRTVDMTTGEEDIKNSLRILFTTSLGERVMRRRYGSRVPTMVFEPMDSSQRVILRQHILDSILMYESRIRPIEVEVQMDVLEGKLEIAVDYVIVATNNRRNFVYPFYVIEGTEVTK